MLKTTLSFAICLSVAVPVLAQEPKAAEPMFSDSSLEMKTYRAGSSTIEVQAGNDVDLQALLGAAKIKPNDAPEVIVGKIDAVRQRLYPDKEITLSASVPRKPRASVEAIRLWRYYISWNRSSSLSVYWTVMGAAVTFLGDVRGTWYYYECNACSTWKYRNTVGTGGTFTRALYGGYYTRGFYYRPVTYGARADVIMYFFD